LPPIHFILHEAVSGTDEENPVTPALKTIVNKWDSMTDVAELLEHALVDSPPPVITEGGLFKTGFNEELDELIQLTEHGESTLAGLLEKERVPTTCPSSSWDSTRFSVTILKFQKPSRGRFLIILNGVRLL
ncbi:hypothetical protein ADUPG1_002493, partial [Aduncisulcus paluster]